MDPVPGWWFTHLNIHSHKLHILNDNDVHPTLIVGSWQVISNIQNFFCPTF